MAGVLEGKIAIVTGGGGDLGSAIAKTLAAAGAKVVLASRDQEKLDAVADQIRAQGGEALGVATDVTDPVQAEKMVDRTIEAFGALDILVNNAGHALHFKPPEQLTPEEWNEGIALNLTSVFLCSLAASRVMIPQNSGRIVNLSSMAGGGEKAVIFAHYGAAKAGVINLTQSLASAWAPHNVNVNCVVPGAIATPQVLRLGLIPPETFPDGTRRSRLQMPPPPEAVANLALFLVSPASASISGESIPVRLVN